MDDCTKKVYKKMIPKFARTSLSVESALTGRHNVKAVPLGAKLPMVPGCHIVLSTVKLGSKVRFCFTTLLLLFPKAEMNLNFYASGSQPFCSSCTGTTW